jgi:lipopolysaccharide assembly outer membrane protein LptD (OstA)
MIQITRFFFAKRRYYFALSDHYDLTVLGDYYTNGSYGMRFESSYAKDMLIEVI